jgi:hypothetical protein
MAALLCRLAGDTAATLRGVGKGAPLGRNNDRHHRSRSSRTAALVRIAGSGIFAKQRGTTDRNKPIEIKKGAINCASAIRIENKPLRRFAPLRYATASTASAADRRALGAHGEIDGTEVTAALLAVRLATINTGSAINTHRVGVVIGSIDRTGSQVFIDDGLHKSACAHRANFKQANLLARQTHLRHGIVDHHAEFGMETNLKRFDSHKRTNTNASGFGECP